ncbi:hypothetical protein NQ315_016987 [Exocentrus adspersus]|uniref:Uncharacterized protein n=1 Tax=Exocentrus adspersus TaxID=1586481 RepID=A0AAV8V8A5_9CUCU|nr:hypothetical protein NQ315_016987 [Exocentrus adspersus]
MEERNHRSKYIKRLLLLWSKKRNKVITSLMVCLIFSVALIIVIVETRHQFVTHEATPASELIEELSTISETEFRDSFDTETNFCFLEDQADCIIACQNTVDVNISALINKLNLGDCSIQNIKLILYDVYFTNHTMNHGWLNGTSPDIQELTIHSPLLMEINEGAFSGKPFESLQTLVIADTRIKYLRKYVFKDTKLQTFEFRCNVAGNIYIEFNALEYIANYLSTLQFNQCIDDFVAVTNITGTGTAMFNKLTSIDISYNTFTNIASYAFVNTPQLISLYLISNNINCIDVKAFEGIGNSLQLLSLRSNKLRTLQEGVFDGFTRGGQIDIYGNPWDCDCDLAWFKEYYIRNIQRYFLNGSIPFICRTFKDYSEVQFCPSTSKRPEMVTTTTTTNEIETMTPTKTSTVVIATTQSPEDFIYLDCTDITTYPDISLEGLNRIYTHKVQVRNGTIVYNFYQIEGTPDFEIKILNNVGSEYLLWINTKNSSDYGCVTNVQDTVILSNLHYGYTYTICLLKETADTVTPFDCTALTVPLEWNNCPWLLNKHMPLVIGGLIGIILAIIIVTSTVMFYTIRQNPKLIRGNKRVVIVRNKSADALVMPNYDRQPYIPPSIYTNSEGYLTPRNKLYEKVHERRIRPLNSITEKFYQDLHGSTSRQPRSNYTGFLHRRSAGSEVYEAPPVAPPLPPNHPSDKAGSSRHSSLYKN